MPRNSRQIVSLRFAETNTRTYHCTLFPRTHPDKDWLWVRCVSTATMPGVSTIDSKWSTSM